MQHLLVSELRKISREAYHENLNKKIVETEKIFPEIIEQCREVAKLGKFEAYIDIDSTIDLKYLKIKLERNGLAWKQSSDLITIIISWK